MTAPDAGPPQPPLAPHEALARIVAAIRPLPVERVPLAAALGRVLAEPVRSPLTLPAWNNSGMDGYAVRAADVLAASADAPVTLRVLETVAAGDTPTRAVGAGEATRIMTGAAVPDGADTVVRVEDTDAGLDRVAVRDPRDAGRNVRPRGEDLDAGAVALPAGTPVGPAQIALLAACGAAVVSVHRRPRVAIAGSGDELVELDRFAEALGGRRMVSTNGYALEAAVREAGGEPVSLGIAPDSLEAIRDRLAAAAGCDLLVTTGGNSVGAYDYTRAAVLALGGTLDFWRVRIRPGAPLAFGTVFGATPWLGLPGNPTSALVTFELFVRPAIRRLLGHPRPARRPVQVTLEQEVSTPGRLTYLVRAAVAVRDGRLVARPSGGQGSGLLVPFARANALLVVPEEREGAMAGEVLEAILLGDDALSAAADG